MTASAKGNSSKQDRKTRAQLQQELAEAHDALQEAQAHVRLKTDEVGRLEQELEELQRITETMSEEKDELERRLQAAEEKVTKLAEAAKREKREAEKQRIQLENRIQELESTIASFRDKLSAAQEAEEVAPEELPASKATFRIHVYPRQGHYHGKIEHVLSGEKKPFRGLDREAIFQFISSHLPQLEEGIEAPQPTLVEPTPSVSEAEPALPEEERVEVTEPHREAAPESVVLQEVQLQQSGRLLETGQPLQAHRPFVVHTRLRLPETPTVYNIDIDTTSYAVSVVVKDVERKEPVATNGVADDLQLGTTDYESHVEMPELEPGAYTLDVCALVPFNRIGEQRSIEVVAVG